MGPFAPARAPADRNRLRLVHILHSKPFSASPLPFFTRTWPSVASSDTYLYDKWSTTNEQTLFRNALFSTLWLQLCPAKFTQLPQGVVDLERSGRARRDDFWRRKKRRKVVRVQWRRSGPRGDEDPQEVPESMPPEDFEIKTFHLALPTLSKKSLEVTRGWMNPPITSMQTKATSSLPFCDLIGAGREEF